MGSHGIGRCLGIKLSIELRNHHPGDGRDLKIVRNEFML